MKTITVKVGDVVYEWKLGKTQAISRQGPYIRVLARAEVARVLELLIDIKENVKFFAEENSRISSGYIARIREGGAVSFGCNHFSKTATKQLAKWAGIKI
jgi:hypothetical protein